MMREILFHGKRVDNGKWIEGYLVSIHDGRTFIIPFGSGCFRKSPYIPYRYEVDTNTVGQFCWILRDDTNAFVGDRVKVRGTKRTGVYETEIVEDSQGFTLKENKTYYKDNRCFLAILEVTGNIHDK